MAETFEVKTWLVVFGLCMVLTMQLQHFSVCAEPQVPCFFIFGGSLTDNGNNNQLDTKAKANYLPYGTDYPDGPTGRFSNGRTVTDILAEQLGFEKPIPSFAAANNSLEGVNYASGSAGILEETGRHLGENIYLGRQLINHGTTVSRIVAVLGERKATERLNKCFYFVAPGNCDYLNNYYVPGTFYPYRRLYDPEQYADLLIRTYRSEITTLYNYGARLVSLAGLGQIGCLPISINLYGNGSGCVDYINDAAQVFNRKLVALVDELNNNFTDAKFTYINTYGIASENATAGVFKFRNVECCVVNKNGYCVPSKEPCKNRHEYVFWDSFNPTEAYSLFVTNRTYHAVDPSDSYPMDISSLVQLGRVRQNINMSQISTY